MCEQGILSQLSLDSLGEFLPIQVADQSFELRLIQIISIPHGCHI